MFTSGKKIPSYQAVSQADGSNESSVAPNSNVSDGESSLLLSTSKLSPESKDERKGEFDSNNSPSSIKAAGTTASERRVETPVINARAASAALSSLLSGGGIGGRNSRTLSYDRPSSVSNSRFIVIVIISYVAAIVLGSFGYSTLRDRVLSLTNKVTDLSDYISKQKTQNDDVTADIQRKLIDQQAWIVRLSNTSNAYVLDQLKDTKLDFFDQMKNTQSSVHLELQLTERNITQKIVTTQSAVAELLVKSNDALQIAQNNISRSQEQSRLD